MPSSGSLAEFRRFAESAGVHLRDVQSKHGIEASQPECADVANAVKNCLVVAAAAGNSEALAAGHQQGAMMLHHENKEERICTSTTHHTEYLSFGRKCIAKSRADSGMAKLFAQGGKPCKDAFQVFIQDPCVFLFVA